MSNYNMNHFNKSNNNTNCYTNQGGRTPENHLFPINNNPMPTKVDYRKHIELSNNLLYSPESFKQNTMEIQNEMQEYIYIFNIVLYITLSSVLR